MRKDKSSKKENAINNVAEKIKKNVKHEKKPKTSSSFEKKKDLEQLYVYVVIVSQQVANTVLKLLQNIGSSAQFVHNGRGTAPNEVLAVIGAKDAKKAVINAFVSEDKLKLVQEELDIFFSVGHKNRGIAFAIPLSSIQGVRMYKYLTQTI